MATASPPIHTGRPSALGLVGVISPSPSSPTSAVPNLSPASPATGPNSPSNGHGVVAARTETFAFHMKFEDVLVPMRDGVRLAGDLYLPAIDGEVEEGRQFPCVLIRTPYNKSAENPDLRSPGIFWTQNGYACYLQDVRGRFKSAGEFYKYTGEAPDGYDTVEWLAEQPWCNGNICTDGPSYLCHVQTSMCLLKPPHLRACFMVRHERRDTRGERSSIPVWERNVHLLYCSSPMFAGAVVVSGCRTRAVSSTRGRRAFVRAARSRLVSGCGA